MIAGSSRVFLEVVAATLLGALLLGAAAAWRLSQGPVSLEFLTPSIEEAFNQQDLGFKVTIADTIVTWAGRERNLDIVAVNVRVLGRDGRLVTAVPNIAVHFSMAGLLRGVVALKRVELIGPRLRLVRSKAGRFAFAFEDTGDFPAGQAGDLVHRLLPASSTVSALRDLERISIKNAELTVDDRMGGSIWGSPRVDAVLFRDGEDLRANFDMDLDIGAEQSTRLEGNVFLRQRDKIIRAEIRFADLRVDLLARRLSSLKQLEGVRLAVDGRATVELDGAGRLVAADFEIKGRDGRVLAPALWPEALPVKSLMVRGRVQQNPDFAVFDEIRLDIGGPTVSGNAVITRIGESAAFNGHALVRDMPIRVIRKFWPADLQRKARDWIIPNIRAGTLREIRLDISAHTGGGGKGGLQVDSLTGTMRFDGASVRYLDELPPATNVAGVAVFNLKQFIITLSNGELDELRGDSGLIEFTRLDSDDEHARIELVLNGPLQTALRMINHPAYGFASAVDIDPQNTTGEIAARLIIDFPLRQGLTLPEVTIGAAANLRGVAIPGIIAGHGLSDGNLSLRVDRSGLEVRGTAKLGPAAANIEWYQDFDDAAKVRRRVRVTGVLGEAERKALGLELSPYLRGPVDVEVALMEHDGGAAEAAIKLGLKPATLEFDPLGWAKAPGVDGVAWLTVRLSSGHKIETVDFDIRTAGLRSKGRVIPPSGDDGLRITLGKFATGATDISGTIIGRADGGFDVRLQGPGLDAAPILRLGDKESFGPDLPPVRITVKLDQLWFSTGPPAGDVAGTLVYDGETWNDIDLDGSLGKEQRIGFSLRKDGPVRTMSFRSSNGGAALKTLGLFDSMANGKLRLSGKRDGSKPAAPWRGRLLITNFRIINASLLTRLLSLGSFTGIADVLSGKGIAFARFDMPYTFRNKVLVLQGARAVGDALGLTASGELDFVRDRIKLDGTLVPANTLNTLVANIPVLGKILTGSERAGVFAMHYGVRGALNKPTVTVNPLTALAPGFLRDLVGVLTGTGAKLPPTTPSETAPADD